MPTKKCLCYKEYYVCFQGTIMKTDKGKTNSLVMTE